MIMKDTIMELNITKKNEMLFLKNINSNINEKYMIA